MIYSTIFKMAKPYLMKKDPEQAHILTLKMLKILGAVCPTSKKNDHISYMGLEFPNKLGLAAGFDKNAEAINGAFALGFGFVEIGTVTPLPQKGNSEPRLFRLKEDNAVINRMGFNNDGAEIVSKRLKKFREKGKTNIVGVNIGANKNSENRIDDYAKCAEYFLDTASYFTINVSSPNTNNLRDLQKPESLIPLLESTINVTKEKPVLLKIAPDLMHEDVEEIAEVINNLPIAGVITTNTTISRPDILNSKYKSEEGGLSGAPLFDLSTAFTELMRSLLLPEKIIIGAGGISSADTAKHKLEVGANLLQIYSCLVYEGPKLIKTIIGALEQGDYKH